MKDLIIIIITIIFIGCSTDNECTNILPDRSVSYDVYFNLPEGIKLQNENYLILPNQGIKGVVIYKGSYKYKAYDLASPHLYIDDSCSVLKITDDKWQLKNECDGALFLLETGQPLNEISRCSLKEYYVYNTGTGIIIRN